MAKGKKIGNHKIPMEFLWEVGAKIVYATDRGLDKVADFLDDKVIPFLKDICEEIGEIALDGLEGATDVGAALIRWYDKSAELVEWFVKKTAVLIMRKYHDLLMDLAQYRRVIIRDFMIILIVGVGAVAVFASAVDYEYAYNGRTLGIVKEQRDVLEILEMVSEELSLEYGSSIVIDPETDITFKPVISYGKDIDDADTVLRRFTYMGDIQAQAFAIVVDGERIATVESEKIAQDVLDSIKAMYTKDSDAKYEYVGFAEDVKIEPYNTTLANVSSKSAALKKIKSGGQQKVTYTVKSGDTLYGICDKLGVNLQELKKMNPKIKDTMTLHVGDKFVTQQEIPLITVETVEVSVFAEAIDYKTVTKESSKYYKGETVVTQAGKKGKARVTARLTKHNGVTVDREDLSVETIKKPVNKIVVKGTKAVPAKKGTGTFMRPVNVGVYAGYGMRWGRMHYGLDYAAPTGTPIYAADGGTVTSAGWSGAYGYTIVIDHGANKKTLYAHCSRLFVSAGTKVYKGQHIAAVGSTGRTTGPHCHFEIFINGANVNPSYYV
ncbi:MAG: peptidoglycan DD-metalloendopeptidase family protein [Firmicutes bacterium]|nr:peptidoglycan DD-metalloendopeptidase family protein [Bacillota bacterium]